MTKTTTITATLIVALSAALISGCTPAGPEVIRPTAPAPTVTAEPTEEPTEAPEEPAEIVVGGTVDEDTARELNREFKDTVSAYQLSDGSYVVIDREQPLPEPVKAEVGATVDAKADSVASDPVYAGVTDTIKAEQQSTGRKVIAVLQVSVFCTSASETRTTAWKAVTAQGWSECFGGRDAAVAYAQQFVAGQDHPTSWEIVG